MWSILQEAMYYMLFTNPVNSGVSYIWNSLQYLIRPVANEIKMQPPVPLWKLAATAGPYVRLAALSGTAAVIIGAYGSHMQHPEKTKEHERQVFKTASDYHFIHTLALLGVPLCRARFCAASFFLSGIVLFCGTCYYSAFTGNKHFQKLTPVGGVCFILGWMSMCI